MEEQTVACPKCKSTQITGMNKGFSGGKAVAGAVLTGGIGLLAGTHGSKKLIVACLNCGNKWDPAVAYKKVQREESAKATQEQYKAMKEKSHWKEVFYSIYELGDFARAEEHYLTRERFTNFNPNVHNAYKKLKAEDRTKTIITVVFIMLIVLFFTWVAA